MWNNILQESSTQVEMADESSNVLSTAVMSPYARFVLQPCVEFANLRTESEVHLYKPDDASCLTIPKHIRLPFRKSVPLAIKWRETT